MSGAGAELQRVDREFSVLLQELRVAQTGVRILFGFLLTVPFSNRFALTTTLRAAVYATTLLTGAIATALAIAPVSRHRRLFRRGRKPQLLAHGDRMAQAALLALAATVTGAVFLVLDVLAGLPAACPLSAAIAGIYAVLWFPPARGGAGRRSGRG